MPEKCIRMNTGGFTVFALSNLSTAALERSAECINDPFHQIHEFPCTYTAGPIYHLHFHVLNMVIEIDMDDL